MTPSRYIALTREEWAKLRAATPMTLAESELAELQGINERLSMAEVEEIYLPLSRLLNLYVGATQDLHAASDAFLGALASKVPYVIGLAGSVAVGKSTTARVLQTLLGRWPDHPRVELVTTDGFLFPNAVLEERGIMNRKGFPESYDQRGLVDFLAAVKAGEPRVEAPVYSHHVYDIVATERLVVCQPDIVIVEGLNVLQPEGLVSDYFDISIYVDAAEEHIEQWYIERFLTLRQTAFRDPEAYFHRFSSVSDEEALRMARFVWREINGTNLRENILPTRERADLILVKGPDHGVVEVKLRKL